MLFNSIDFAIYLPIVFGVYWLIQKNLNLQNLFIVFASYFFYGWWNWRFLSLLLISTIVDFSIGRFLAKSEDITNRKILLWISIFVNIGFLAFFKYYNFFIDSFVSAFTFMGADLTTRNLNIILPVGISFYTFQTLSYTIDIYKKKLSPTHDFVAFAAFVSFFPQLVAGPIERAKNLLPQFYIQRTYENKNAVEGMRQILWGFFKKIVIADNCAVYVNDVFANYADYPGSTLLIGATFFAFQIYCDFSGYSDIAIGTARLFGFKLMQNFAFPYFSRDMGEFWRRWHISLSTWFRDYLYIPLGGSRGGIWKKTRNVFIIFLVSGFWHGANWTFIIWGALHAVYFLPLMLIQKNRQHIEIVANNRFYPTIKESLQILSTFFLTVIAWVFFRAENITHAFSYLKVLFINNLYQHPGQVLLFFKELAQNEMFFPLLFLLAIEWSGRRQEFPIAKLGGESAWVFRWIFYYALAIMIFLYYGHKQT
ncbi:MAG: MBOAT family protein, partial [Desulfobacteraceae bacterium]|nr:MBOAT family protein [Desulfobacteraceae bacterium]